MTTNHNAIDFEARLMMDTTSDEDTDEESVDDNKKDQLTVPPDNHCPGNHWNQQEQKNKKDGRIKDGPDKKLHHFAYTVRLKVKIAREANAFPFNKRKTCAKYKIQLSQLNKWYKSMPKLLSKCQENPRARTTHQGKPTQYPELEQFLYDWVMDKREEDIQVTTNDILKKAIAFIGDGFKDNKAKRAKRWIYVFMERWGLSIRRKTRIGQKLSGHLKEVQEDCASMICQRFSPLGTLSNVPLNMFLNMDQTNIYFELKSDTTVDKKGKKSIAIRDSGSNSKRCTVALTVAADGTKLPPFLFSKQQRLVRLHKKSKP